MKLVPNHFRLGFLRCFVFLPAEAEGWACFTFEGNLRG
jgi:hypothetical protein